VNHFHLEAFYFVDPSLFWSVVLHFAEQQVDLKFFLGYDFY